MCDVDVFTISSMKHLLLPEAQGYIVRPRVVDSGSAKSVGDGLTSGVVGGGGRRGPSGRSKALNHSTHSTARGHTAMPSSTINVLSCQ